MFRTTSWRECAVSLTVTRWRNQSVTGETTMWRNVRARSRRLQRCSPSRALSTGARPPRRGRAPGAGGASPRTPDRRRDEGRGATRARRLQCRPRARKGEVCSLAAAPRRPARRPCWSRSHRRAASSIGCRSTTSPSTTCRDQLPGDELRRRPANAEVDAAQPTAGGAGRAAIGRRQSPRRRGQVPDHRPPSDGGGSRAPAALRISATCRSPPPTSSATTRQPRHSSGGHDAVAAAGAGQDTWR